MSGGTYTGERRLGGELVRGPDDDLLDKHLDVVRISPGGFDWGDGADDEGVLQLAVALLAAEVDADTARQHHHRFAAYLQERLTGDEWSLPAGEVCEANWRRATSFDNRADVDADTAPPTDGEGETADDGKRSGGGDTASVETVAGTVVEDVLASLEDRGDVTLDDIDGVTNEAVQRELRASAHYRATEAHHDVGDVRSAASSLLQERLTDSGDGGEGTTQSEDSPAHPDDCPEQGAQGQGRATSDGGVRADEFEWVSLS